MNLDLSHTCGRRGFLLLLFMFVPTVTIFGQGLIGEFRQYIPEQILKDQASARSLEGVLDAAGRLHPELLYYELQKINHLYTDTSLYRYSALHARQMQLEYRRKRSRWGQTVLAGMEARGIEKDKITLCRVYLDRFIAPDSSSEVSLVSLPVDSVAMNDVVVRYLEYWGSYGGAPPGVTDGRDRKRVEKWAQEQAIRIALNRDNPIDEEDLRDLLDRWYLFPGPTESVRMDDEESNYLEALSRVLDRLFGAERLQSFQIGIGANGFIPAEHYEFGPSAAYPTLSDGRALSMEYPTSQISVSLCYRLPLREEVGSFSYLSLRGSYGWMKKGTPREVTIHSIAPGGGLMTFYLRPESELSLTIWTLELGAPLLMFGRNFSIEGSILLLQQIRQFDVKYSAPGPDSGEFVESGRIPESSFTGALGGKYIFQNGIFAQLMITPKFTQVMIGYGF